MSVFNVLCKVVLEKVLHLDPHFAAIEVFLQTLIAWPLSLVKLRHCLFPQQSLSFYDALMAFMCDFESFCRKLVGKTMREPRKIIPVSSAMESSSLILLNVFISTFEISGSRSGALMKFHWFVWIKCVRCCRVLSDCVESWISDCVIAFGTAWLTKKFKYFAEMAANSSVCTFVEIGWWRDKKSDGLSRPLMYCMSKS